MKLNEYIASKIVDGEYELKETYIIALARHFKITVGAIRLTIIISRLGKVNIAIESLDYDSMLVYDEAFEQIQYDDAPVYESSFFFFHAPEESSNMIAEKLINDHASGDKARKDVTNFLVNNIADARSRAELQPKEKQDSVLLTYLEVIISRTIDMLENN